MRGIRKSSIAPNMLLELENIFIEESRKAFFSSSYNNQKFIEDHHTVVRCNGDASTMVVSTVLDYACTGGNVELISADTDILIMLIYVWNSILGEITMNSEATKKHKAIKCDIGNTVELISDVWFWLMLLVNVTQPQQHMKKVNCRY